MDPNVRTVHTSLLLLQLLLLLFFFFFLYLSAEILLLLLLLQLLLCYYYYCYYYYYTTTTITILLLLLLLSYIISSGEGQAGSVSVTPYELVSPRFAGDTSFFVFLALRLLPIPVITSNSSKYVIICRVKGRLIKFESNRREFNFLPPQKCWFSL